MVVGRSVVVVRQWSSIFGRSVVAVRRSSIHRRSVIRSVGRSVVASSVVDRFSFGPRAFGRSIARSAGRLPFRLSVARDAAGLAALSLGGAFARRRTHLPSGCRQRARPYVRLGGSACRATSCEGGASLCVHHPHLAPTSADVAPHRDDLGPSSADAHSGLGHDLGRVGLGAGQRPSSRRTWPMHWPMSVGFRRLPSIL